MKTYSEFLLNEQSSLDVETLGHLSHTKDIPHEAPQHAQTAINLIRDFHSHRQGNTPKGFGASLKADGGAQVRIKHDDKGIAVTDKHRGERKNPVEARTPEEVDQHFGHMPAYAAAMKHVLHHGAEFVNRGHTVAGDLKWTPGDEAKRSGGTTTTTPNRITYKAKSKAPVGIALHTEFKNGKAMAISKKATKKSSNVFTPDLNYSKPNPSTYSKSDRDAVEHHLGKAQELLNQHSHDHMTADHRHPSHYSAYLNAAHGRGERPTLTGYKKHLTDVGERMTSKLKSEKGQAKKRAHYQGLVSHVDEHAPHFERSMAIRHHLGKATDHALRGIEHSDMHTSIDGKKSPGEGVVLHRGGRVMTKLVPSSVQKALRNNPRFMRENIMRGFSRLLSESNEGDSHSHVFYGKVQYATLGHKSGVDQMRSAADADRKSGKKVSTVIGLSNTGGPLGVEGKKEHAESIFGHPVETGQAHTSNLFSFLEDVHKRGHTHLTIHAGSDRAPMYQEVLDRYNGKPDKKGNVLFNFKSAQVKQIGGERDEGELTKHPEKMTDKELTSTAKASRMREYAKKGDEASRRAFHAYHRPLGLSKEVVEGHWNKLKTAMANQPEPKPKKKK